jgi:hypothetical protein
VAHARSGDSTAGAQPLVRHAVSVAPARDGTFRWTKAVLAEPEVTDEEARAAWPTGTCGLLSAGSVPIAARTARPSASRNDRRARRRPQRAGTETGMCSR